MSSPRERAIGALLERRGIAGLFGRPEAEADVAAIEAAGIDLAPRDASPEHCPRCDAVNATLAEPGSRVYRGTEGGLIVVGADADPEEARRAIGRVDGVELVAKPGRVTMKDGSDPAAGCTGGSLGVTAPHEPLRAVSDETPADEPTDDEAPCASTLFPGVECRDEQRRPRPYGHPLPHTGRGPSGSAMTWSTKEGTTDG